MIPAAVIVGGLVGIALGVVLLLVQTWWQVRRIRRRYR
jgi:uncharacterized membrane-anchored protein